jgi:hypothetical protein
MIAEHIGPHGPASPLLFSYRMAKYAVFPESSGSKVIITLFCRVKRLLRKSLPDTGGVSPA